MSAEMINISFYRFVDLTALGHTDLTPLRYEMRSYLKQLGFTGTLLIAPEGLNAMLSGTRAAIDTLRADLGARFGVPSSAFKETPVEKHSFGRLLVRLKKEIITVGDPDLSPAQMTGTPLPGTELKKWLDEGKDVVLLDTRNEYEIGVGTFKGALSLGLDASSEFAAKAKTVLPDLKDKTVVTFCTGGIRCEKGSALLLKLGLKNVYQLEGGILRYFEENGSAHFDGACFVFDGRKAVDGNLKPVARSDDPKQSFGRHRYNYNG